MKKLITDEQINYIKAHTSAYWADYTIKTAQRAVWMSDGTLHIIVKPNIKTSFCFGYGMYLQSTEEEHQRATDMADYAETNAQYFIDENMKGFNPFERKYPYGHKTVVVAFTNAEGIVQLYPARECDLNDWQYKNARRLTAEEEQTLRQVYAEETERHLKRLQTYLKRYGLSNLRVWTYLVD